MLNSDQNGNGHAAEVRAGAESEPARDSSPDAGARRTETQGEWSVARQSGESREAWAERLAADFVRESKAPRRGWSPLRLFGLSIQP